MDKLKIIYAMLAVFFIMGSATYFYHESGDSDTSSVIDLLMLMLFIITVEAVFGPIKALVRFIKSGIK